MNLNRDGTFLLVENCSYLSCLIRVNPCCSQPRHSRTILMKAKRH